MVVVVVSVEQQLITMEPIDAVTQVSIRGKRGWVKTWL